MNVDTFVLLTSALLSAAPDTIEIRRTGEDSPFTPHPMWDAWGSRPDSEFGSSIAAGDINNDGFADAVIAAPGEAALYVYFGSRDGLSREPIRIPRTGQNGEHGHRVWLADDATGDKFGDLLVEIRSTNNKVPIASLFLHRGSATQIHQARQLITNVRVLGENRPFALTPYDLNKDKLTDVIIAYCQERRLELRLGSKEGFTKPKWSKGFPSPVPHVPKEWPTVSCSVEIVPPSPSETTATLVLRTTNCDPGPESNCETELALITQASDLSFQSSARYIDMTRLVPEGHDQTTVGDEMNGRSDVNGDSHFDLILTAPFVEQTAEKGSLYVLRGPLSTEPILQVLKVFQGTELGRTTITTGDITKDGKADLIVGGVSLHNTGTAYDRVLLLRGEENQVSPTVNWHIAAGGRHQRLGESLASGDFNGDGLLDLLVGVPGERVSVAAIPWPGHAVPKSLVFGKALLFLGRKATSGDTTDEHASSQPTRAMPRPACIDLTDYNCGF